MLSTVELPRESWERSRSLREIETLARQGAIKKYPRRRNWFARLIAKVARRKRRK